MENKGKELAKEIEKQYNKSYEMLKEALAPLYDELLVFKEKGVGGIDSIDICYVLENNSVIYNIVSIFIGNKDGKIVRLKYKLESLLSGHFSNDVLAKAILLDYSTHLAKADFLE